MSVPIFVTNYLKEKGLASTSILRYTAHLKKYMHSNEWDDSCLYDLERINKHNQIIPLKAREGFLISITHAFDAYTQKQRQHLRELTKHSVDDCLIDNIKKLKNEQEEKIQYENVIKIGDISQKNKINDLICKLYTLEVPLRADTWSRMCVCNTDPPVDNVHNYINLDTGIIYLNKYKTVRTYGKKQLVISEKMRLYIKKWWGDNHGWLGNIQKFLVTDKDGNMLSPANFNTRLKTIFGYGSSVLRHSYISYMRRMGKSMEELHQIAGRMNTSFLQLNLVYDDTHEILHQN